MGFPSEVRACGIATYTPSGDPVKKFVGVSAPRFVANHLQLLNFFQ
jgi:hypothetical protein